MRLVMIVMRTLTHEDDDMVDGDDKDANYIENDDDRFVDDNDYDDNDDHDDDADDKDDDL